MKTRIRVTVVGMLACWLAAAPVFVPLLAEPISVGAGKQTVNLGGTRMDVYTYRPAQCPDPSLLLVFHGAARDAEDYRDYARGLADRQCMLVVAPLFDRKRFRPGAISAAASSMCRAQCKTRAISPADWCSISSAGRASGRVVTSPIR